jgi:2-oxoglutarate ferredoxin oxidoreductase subunit gamma
MAIGKILAKAAMEEGKHVTWMPSYGPEMRGGTANCIVIIDDEPIGSPVAREPAAAIVMNKQSIDKFEPSVKKGGLLVVNTSLIDREAVRFDIRVMYVAANELAEKEGSGKSANMVALGAYVALIRTTSVAAVEHAIVENFKGKRGNLGEINVRAFRRGLEAARVAK